MYGSTILILMYFLVQGTQVMFYCLLTSSSFYPNVNYLSRNKNNDSNNLLDYVHIFHDEPIAAHNTQ